MSPGLEPSLHYVLMNWKAERNRLAEVVDRNEHLTSMDVPVTMYVMLDQHIREIEAVLNDPL